MIKLLIGGSPCTYWSIAQKNNRETEPSGMGWELFKNYLIAKEKFKPDFFLYENNKSADEAIKQQIRKELNVWDGTFLMEDSGARYIEINSALVSAQNRQRFYVHNCGDVGQPGDRGILLRDVLESGVVEKDKAYCLKHQAGNARDYFKKHHTNIALEPVRIPEYSSEKSRPINASYKNKGSGEGSLASECFPDNPNKQVFDYVAEPVNITADGKAQTLKAQYSKNNEMNFCCYHSTYGATGVAERVYYGAEAVEFDENGKPTKARSYADGKIYTVYEVRNGKITIKGKEYPIKLADGFYIIRKLTVTECCRLQTMPDDYCLAVSNAQAYKGLGNGWTAEVIIHILSHALKNVPKDEKIVVLSMYDGIGTGRYCLDKMGFTNVEYRAYEIDKYAMQIAMSNYPDIIQHGDAFAVRNEDWKL